MSPEKKMSKRQMIREKRQRQARMQRLGMIGAIVVGAVNSQNGDLEKFSSQGPTNHGKLAPLVVGPDGVTTLAYEGKLFYGTSATTPYIAGIAALLVDSEPEITNEEVLNRIIQNTKPSDFDFISEGGSEPLFSVGVSWVVIIFAIYLALMIFNV